MKEVRNGKKVNFKKIYSQVVKYGKTMSDLAKEYDMDEISFIRRLEMGLTPKTLSEVVKANEKNCKHKKDSDMTQETAEVELKEETDMAKWNQEVARNQNYRQRQSETDKAAKMQKEPEKKQALESLESMNMSDLMSKQADINGEIFAEEEVLEEATQILAIREKAFTETQRVFEEAKTAFNESENELNKAKSTVELHSKSIKELKEKLANVETQILALRNKDIYLVAPGFTGEKPAYGTFYSTSKVNGYETLSVVEAAPDYAIEPELKDMVVAGYDSYKEYMEALRFIMLCAEYTCNDKAFTVLVADERLKKLMKAHIG